MSAERCVNIIDGILNILDEADKKDEHNTSGKTCGASSGKTCTGKHDSSEHGHGHGHEHGHAHAHEQGHEHAHEHEQVHQHTHEKGHEHGHEHEHEHKTCSTAATEEASKVFVYFQSLDEIEESQLVQLTPDVTTLRTKWKEAGLVDNDELEALCKGIGKVVEIETSDDTLQIQWENYDTCWVPAFACGRPPSGAKATIPGTNNSWLNESKAVGAEYEEELKQQQEESAAQEDGPLLANAEDAAVKEGKTLRVTRDLTTLQEKWKYCELPEADLHRYLGAVGTIQEIAEDDDTVNLRWDNNETSWVPVQACMDAKDANPTVPAESHSHSHTSE